MVIVNRKAALMGKVTIIAIVNQKHFLFQKKTFNLN